MDALTRQQAAEGFENLAKLSRNLFLQFVAEGFTDSQALTLTRAWMVQMLGQSLEEDA